MGELKQKQWKKEEGQAGKEKDGYKEWRKENKEEKAIQFSASR